MDSGQRKAFVAAYGPGIALLVLSYVLLTALRDFRDNFAAELWTGLGFGKESAVFTASELPVAVLSLGVMAAVMVVRDNLRALLVMHGVILAGFLTLGLSTLAFQAHLLAPLPWMILTGAGLYMAYTPFNAMLFDRMIAFSGRVGTAGFLIYVADASGYLGSVALLVWRNFAMVAMDWLNFFSSAPMRPAFWAPPAPFWPAPISSSVVRRRRLRARPNPSLAPPGCKGVKLAFVVGATGDLAMMSRGRL